MFMMHNLTETSIIVYSPSKKISSHLLKSIKQVNVSDNSYILEHSSSAYQNDSAYEYTVLWLDVQRTNMWNYKINLHLDQQPPEATRSYKFI